jgi:ribosome-associated protein
MRKTDTDVKLKTIINAIDDKKGVNILAFHVTEQSGYTDYMVFVSGTSTQHNKTMWENILKELKNNGLIKPTAEGEKEAAWILVDAGDVVVNIMLEEVRHYYDLETIWQKSDSVSIESLLTK